MSFGKIKWLLIAAVVGVGALIGMLTEMGKAGRFASEGVKAVGTVERVWREESRGRRGSVTQNYYMALTYDAQDGSTVRVERHGVNESSFMDHRRGARVNLTYVRSNPQEIHIGHKEYSTAHIPFLAALATGCLGFVGWQCRSLIGLGVTAAGRAAASTTQGDGDQHASDLDRRMEEAISRAATAQKRQPAAAYGSSAGPMQSRGFQGAAASEAPRATFGRRRA